MLAGRSRPALAVVDQAILSGTSVITSVTVGRLAGETELGLYAIGLSIVLLVSAVQDSLICVPYIFFRERGERERAYAGSILIHHAMLAAVSVLGMGVAAAFFALRPESSVPVTLTAAVAVAVPGMLVHELARQMTFAHHRVEAALVVDAAAAFLQMGGLAALALWDQLSAPGALAVVGAARGAAGFTRLALSRRTFVFRSADWRGTLARHWRFARLDLSAQVVGTIEGYASHWILTVIRGAGATGALAASMTIATATNPLLLGLHHVFVPRIADAHENGGPREVWRVVRRTTTIYMRFLSVFSLALIVFGGTIVRLVYGPEFAGNGEVVAILSVLALASAVELTAANGLRALRRPQAYLLANGVGLAVVALAAPILCTLWGVAGAAAAMLAGVVIETAIEWQWLRRLSGR